MNTVEADAMALACRYVADSGLVAVAALARGTLTDAIEAVPSRSVGGRSDEAGTVWVNPGGVRVWTSQLPSEVSVTWRQVAEVLMPVLCSGLGVELLAAYHDRSTGWPGNSHESTAVGEWRWYRARASVLGAAGHAMTTQRPRGADSRSPRGSPVGECRAVVVRVRVGDCFYDERR